MQPTVVRNLRASRRFVFSTWIRDSYGRTGLVQHVQNARLAITNETKGINTVLPGTNFTYRKRGLMWDERLGHGMVSLIELALHLFDYISWSPNECIASSWFLSSTCWQNLAEQFVSHWFSWWLLQDIGTDFPMAVDRECKIAVFYTDHTHGAHVTWCSMSGLIVLLAVPRLIGLASNRDVLLWAIVLCGVCLHEINCGWQQFWCHPECCADCLVPTQEEAYRNLIPVCSGGFCGANCKCKLVPVRWIFCG